MKRKKYFFIFFLTFLCAELAFRILISLNLVEYPKVQNNKIIHKYSDNRDLIYELKPNFISDDGINYTNSHGMRDYEYSFNKSAGVKRICILGDSVAYGLHVRLEQTFDNLLERKLNSQNGDKFEVLNFSVTGYNSFQEEIVLKEKVVKFNPDIVVIAFCLNDDLITDGLKELSKAMSPYSIGSQLHSKLISFILYQWENLQSFKDFSKVEHFFQTVALYSKKLKFNALVIILPYNYDGLISYKYIKKHKLVRQAAQKYELPVFDLLGHWEELKTVERRKFYIDKVHLSVYGMQEVSEELYNYLKILFIKH